jgi:CheY-like chemotaxis protein
VRLTHAGHEVVHVANGREALERLRATRPDLLLVETMVPELDGVQLLKQMKQDAVLSSIPVVVVSARAHEDDILAALAAGADDYVTKPVSLRELVARVERVLSQGPEPLRIAVQAEAGPVAVGEVLDANARSTSVRFHREGAPRFAIDEAARLSLSSPSLPSAIALAARVVSRGEGDPYRTYGFELLRRNEHEREMARSYLNLIGRRTAFRAELREDEDIPVSVRAGAGGDSQELLGRLLDLSIGGARLRLKADADRILHRLDAVEIRFAIPGRDTHFALRVSIRHRIAEASGGIAYGVRFDAERSSDFVEQLEQISEFVMERTS